MILRSALIPFALALGITACSDDNKDKGNTTTPCTTAELNASKCAGTSLLRCDGSTWQPAEDCSTSGKTCRAFTDSVAACISATDPSCAVVTQRTTGDWTKSEIDAQDDFISRPGVAMATDGTLHVVYNVATNHENWTTPSVWYATNASGSWVSTELVPAAGLAREYPAVAVNSAGKVAVVFNSYVAETDQTELYLLTNDGTGFTAPANISNSATTEYGAIMGYDADGVLHIVHQKVHDSTDYRIGYTRVAADGTVSQEEVIASSITYAAAFADDGGVHVAYMQGNETTGNSVLWYRYRDPQSGSWSVVERVTAPTASSDWPVLAVGCAGTVHLAYTTQGDDFASTLTYTTRTGGVWAAPQLLTNTVDDRTYNLGMRVNGSGTILLAYSKLDADLWGDTFVLRGQNGVFDAEVQLTDTRDTTEEMYAVALTPDGTSVVVYPATGPDFPASTMNIATW